MSAGKLNRVVQALRKSSYGAALSDGQLLELFLAHQDEAAFAALVKRHGPMVLSVCRRVLGSHHDAEDAFQATFLVLVRKAVSITRRDLLGNWLYGVAYRTALKAKSGITVRRSKETQMKDISETRHSPDPWQDLLPVLDKELKGLPDKYRVPIVLCDLEGKTRKQAAGLLGLAEGTLSTRLARARALLARKLTRHGPGVSAATLASLLAHESAAGSLPAHLVIATARSATACAAGTAMAGMISARIASLTEGVLKMMLLSKLRIALGVLLIVTIAAGGIGFGSFRTSAAEPGGPNDAVAGADVPQPERGREADNLIWNDLGLKLVAVPAAEANRVNRQLHGGLKIVAIRPRSPSAEKKLREGDILVGLHHWELLTEANVSYTLGFCQGAKMETVRFFIVRKGEVFSGWFALPRAGNAPCNLARLGRLPEPKPAKPLRVKMGQVRWRTDYSSGRTEAKEKKLPLCLYFFKQRCPESSRMNSAAFAHLEVVTVLNRNFVPVKLDVTEVPMLANALGISDTPAFVFASWDGRIIRSHPGELDTASFLKILKAVESLSSG